MQIFKTPNFNFVRWRWHAIALSVFIVLAGAVKVYRDGGLPLGVEFEGGTLVVLQFEQEPDLQKIRSALAGGIPNGDDAIVTTYGDAGQRQVMVRVSQVGEEAGSELSRTANLVDDTLQKANIGKFTEVRRDVVGPVVGQQLRRQGTLATVLALTGILVYIGLRFQFSFALGAVTATIHDLFVTLAFLVFFGYDITLNVIAAILTITGYSVNDTIVVFDRVRENMRSMRRDNLEHIVNVAVNQTLARTIITAGTALLSVVALYLFGGEALEGFAFTMIVGIVSGTYSTVFIAAAIAIMLQRGKPLKGQAVTPQTTERTPRRRARAS